MTPYRTAYTPWDIEEARQTLLFPNRNKQVITQLLRLYNKAELQKQTLHCVLVVKQLCNF